MLAVVAFLGCGQRKVLRGEKQVNTALRPERATQNRVIERITRPVAQGGLGYAFLGEWSKREGIHTYKFHQAVEDKVVLDLKYEARTVPQQLTNKKAVDDWFETKTRGLNNYKKSELRRHWATMESLMSAGERKGRIVADIIHDFGVKPRLDNNRGTAILVAASIYDACHYLRLFKNTSFGDYCGIITSYEPNHNAISREPP